MGAEPDSAFSTGELGAEPQPNQPSTVTLFLTRWLQWKAGPRQQHQATAHPWERSGWGEGLPKGPLLKEQEANTLSGPIT